MVKNDKNQKALAQQINKERDDAINDFEKSPYMGYDSLDAAIKDSFLTSQAEVLARLFNRENLFISGAAGSGKTTVIKKFIEILDAEFDGTIKVAVTASTGLAAQLIGGSTIHSWSGLGTLHGKFDKSKTNCNTTFLKEVDVLIIDEISMLSAYYLDNVDLALKKSRKNNDPFGGIQVVFLGDFMQLPPVVGKERIEDLNYDYVVTSNVWKEANIKCCYLDKTHRAVDEKLIYLLDSIRLGEFNDKSQRIVDHCSNNVKDPNKVYTNLFTSNKSVNAYNEMELEKNTNELEVLTMNIVYGSKDNVKKLLKQSTLEEQISLKVGATVIVTKNIPGGNVTNGTVGKIVSFHNYTKYYADKSTEPINSIKIKTNDGNIVYLERSLYKLEEPKTITDMNGKKTTYMQPIVEISQFPIKLGYAITVHKSQGQTFDAVEVDLSQCFQPGLGYVALSRVRSLDDLIITGYNRLAFKVDERSKKISKTVMKKAHRNRKEFLNDINNYEGLLTVSLYRQGRW